MPELVVDDSHLEDTFTLALERGIRAGLTSLVSRLGAPVLAGCALCTDDDLETVYFAVCSVDEARMGSRFAPTNWIAEVALDEAYTLLRRRADAWTGDDGFLEHRLRAFGCMVAALMRVRADAGLRSTRAALGLVRWADRGPT